MIRYALKCADGHSFESWFQSADAFDTLAKRGMVGCAVCGTASVEKALMAPGIAAEAKSEAEAKAEAPARGSLTTPSSPVEKALAELRRKVEENSDYVGMNFAAEARAMHEGAAPRRSIHGEAKPEEARKLIEDGVPVAPLPFLPQRKAN